MTDILIEVTDMIQIIIELFESRLQRIIVINFTQNCFPQHYCDMIIVMV